MALNSSFWDKYFRVYDTLNQSPVYRELIASVLSALSAQKGDYVLDAGVGTGNVAVPLIKAGVRVLGLDFSQEALQIYRTKCSDIEVVRHDLSKPLSFLEDNTFDRVVSNNTLYNIPKNIRVDVLKELRRVLKPGGRIVISNVHKTYKPIRIYLRSIYLTYKHESWYRATYILFRSLYSTLAIFYYNFKIQHAYKVQADNLYDFDGQKKELTQAGFRNVSETVLVFAGQAILNYANK